MSYVQEVQSGHYGGRGGQHYAPPPGGYGGQQYASPPRGRGQQYASPPAGQGYGGWPSNQGPPPGHVIIVQTQSPTRGHPFGGSGWENNSDETADDQFAGSFSEKKIRHAFIRKVCGILSVQMLFTCAILSLFLFVKPIRDFAQKNSWLHFLCLAVYFVTYLILMCVPSTRKKFPTNMILLGIFTLAMSCMVGFMAAHYSVQEVLMAFGITTVIVLALTIFATQTKYDFTGCGTGLMVVTIVLMLFGILAIFFYSNIVRIIYASAGALVFSLWLVYDIQRMVGGKNRRNVISPEEYIAGAIEIYVDVIYIFMNILDLVSAVGGGQS